MVNSSVSHIPDDHHNYEKHPNEVVKNEELTYNSGSGQATLNRPIDVYLWSWSWLPCGTITTTILIAGIFYTFHYLLWTLNNAMDRRIETLGIYRWMCWTSWMVDGWLAGLAEGYRFKDPSLYNIRLAATILLGSTLHKHSYTFLCIPNIRSIEESTNR